MAVAGCGASATNAASAKSSAVINAIGAENEYANVLAQIGGKYVHVSSILNNPNTDPHTFESSPSVASEVSAAQLIVQNGVGYDTFMNKIESASPDAGRKVIIAQNVLGLPDSTPNPHLWYDPKTMPAVAKVDGRGPVGAAARAQGVLPGPAEDIRPVADPVAERHRGVQGQVPRHPGRDHRAGVRLHAASRRDATTSPRSRSRLTS